MESNKRDAAEYILRIPFWALAQAQFTMVLDI
jgi:hypothetical protein